jgi:hypothetical protein
VLSFRDRTPSALTTRPSSSSSITYPAPFKQSGLVLKCIIVKPCVCSGEESSNTTSEAAPEKKEGGDTPAERRRAPRKPDTLNKWSHDKYNENEQVNALCKHYLFIFIFRDSTQHKIFCIYILNNRFCSPIMTIQRITFWI